MCQPFVHHCFFAGPLLLQRWSSQSLEILPCCQHRVLVAVACVQFVYFVYFGHDDLYYWKIGLKSILEGIRLHAIMDRKVRRESVIAVYLSSNDPTKSIRETACHRRHHHLGTRCLVVDPLGGDSYENRLGDWERLLRVVCTKKRTRWSKRTAPKEISRGCLKTKHDSGRPTVKMKERPTNFFCLKLLGTNHHPEIFRGVISGLTNYDKSWPNIEKIRKTFFPDHKSNPNLCGYNKASLPNLH